MNDQDPLKKTLIRTLSSENRIPIRTLSSETQFLILKFIWEPKDIHGGLKITGVHSFMI